MTAIYSRSVTSLAKRIGEMASDLRFNTGLQVMYTGLLMDKYVNARVKGYGQNRSRMDILHTLITHKGVLKPSDLSKMTFRSKQTVTKIVDGLVSDGLATRELEGKDRRTKKISVTEKGIQFVKNSLPLTMDISHECMPILTTEELEQMSSLLRRIRRHILKRMADAGLDDSL
ncbi:MAG: MarR family transcriptional regulator [Dehalococcoidia bacterium]